MATTPALTAKQMKTLQGLYYGPCAVSATERADFETMDLIRKGYARSYRGFYGGMLWEISMRGRDYLRDNAATPSLDDDLL